jgi:hypothetical protein
MGSSLKYCVDGVFMVVFLSARSRTVAPDGDRREIRAALSSYQVEVRSTHEERIEGPLLLRKIRGVTHHFVDERLLELSVLEPAQLAQCGTTY